MHTQHTRLPSPGQVAQVKLLDGTTVRLIDDRPKVPPQRRALMLTLLAAGAASVFVAGWLAADVLTRVSLPQAVAAGADPRGYAHRTVARPAAPVSRDLVEGPARLAGLSRVQPPPQLVETPPEGERRQKVIGVPAISPPAVDDAEPGRRVADVRARVGRALGPVLARGDRVVHHHPPQPPGHAQRADVERPPPRT